MALVSLSFFSTSAVPCSSSFPFSSLSGVAVTREDGVDVWGPFRVTRTRDLHTASLEGFAGEHVEDDEDVEEAGKEWEGFESKEAAVGE